MNADDILAVADAQRQTTPDQQTGDDSVDADLWPEIRRIIETRMSSQRVPCARQLPVRAAGSSRPA
ncbi:hypothetical protein ACW9VS_02855 [Bifidobacterium adolescentis]